MKSLPDDRGLYMPEHLPTLSQNFFNHIEQYTFEEIAFYVISSIVGNELPLPKIRSVVEETVNFPAPVVSLDGDTHVLELFHGPSLAFKDFGARFMAQMMSYYNRGEDQELTILVATSGDTGGAVAAGFYKVPGVRVVILYPSGKVSDYQEKQLTTLGENITALEIDGTFDDCQAIVKTAFLDKELNEKHRLSSANSINIARLLPQSLYYFEAYKQLDDKGRHIAFSIPSGNFGNLTSGLLAKRMGLPIGKFIAATNVNDIVPKYLASGNYDPRPSVQTISNAMDVGNPSNFQRMEDIYGSTWNSMKKDIVGYSYSDQHTELAIKEIHDKFGYVMDPHGAVGYQALKDYQKEVKNTNGVILETAHPAKFLPVMNPILGEIDIPNRLSVLNDKKKQATQLSKSFDEFKSWML